MKRIYSLAIMILGLVLAISLAACTKPASAPASDSSKKVNLYFGSTTSSSANYVWPVAVARVVNKYGQGINITIVESGASYDNARKIREGVFDGGLTDGWHVAFEMKNGLDSFKGDSWDGLRVLAFRSKGVSRTYVRADSNIRTWSDLAGKTITSGMPGSAAADRVMRSIEALGTKVEHVPISLTEAEARLQSGRLDAEHKGSPYDDFDAGVLAVHLKTKLRVIGFSDEEAAKLNKLFPQFLVSKTPAGVIKSAPETPAVWEISTLTTGEVSNRMSQETVYKIIKPMYEHWKEIKQAFPSAADDPIMDYIKVVPPGSEVPLHAGVIQYAKEIGLNIPKSFYPPEYKP